MKLQSLDVVRYENGYVCSVLVNWAGITQCSSRTDKVVGRPFKWWWLAILVTASKVLWRCKKREKAACDTGFLEVVEVSNVDSPVRKIRPGYVTCDARCLNCNSLHEVAARMVLIDWEVDTK